MDQVESFCQKICILKDGHLIVSDELTNIKNAYAYRYLEVETTSNLNDYLKKNHYHYSNENNRYKLRIPKGVEAYRLIQEIGEKFDIRGVSLKEPSLHEIFIERTGSEKSA